MPTSRVRRKAKPGYTPPTGAVKPKPRGSSPPWYTAIMLVLFLIGIVWLVLYYSTSGGIPGQSALGGWNVLVGFGIICVGFALATRWR